MRGQTRRYLAVGAFMLIALFTFFLDRSFNQPVHPEKPDSPKVHSAKGQVIDEPTSIPVISRVQIRQAKAFSILRSPPEGLPKHITHLLRQPIFGINWMLAQHIPTAARGTYWAIPGNGYLCIVSQQEHQPSASTVCETNQYAIHHGLVATSVWEIKGKDTERRIVGLVPDGTPWVQVITHGSARKLIVNRHDVFVMGDFLPYPPSLITLG
jgi:hypothetical protein